MIELPAKYAELDWQDRQDVRRQYIRRQCGMCYHCKRSLHEDPLQMHKINWELFPPTFLNHPIHLHHSHSTGMTIGVVHAYCNAVLWQYYGE